MCHYGINPGCQNVQTCLLAASEDAETGAGGGKYPEDVRGIESICDGVKVTVDERKFAFIMCTNNRQYCLEALHYIKSLAVPDGYTVETCIIEDAKSMTEGYQRAMLSSGAKYKIYLHQDVMIVEKNFLQHLLDIFADRKIGMIGMIGSPRMPENSVMWYGERIGCIYSSSAYHMQMGF